MSKWVLHAMLLTLGGFTLAGCSDGDDADMGAGNPPPPPPPNTTTVNASLNAAQVPKGSTATGTAAAAFTINLDDDTISGTVTLTGITATAVSLRAGFAGEPGPELVALVENSATEWALPANAAFTAEDQADLEAGRLYLRVDTATAPEGALRGQLVVGDIQVLFVDLNGAQEMPPEGVAGRATAAITFDPSTGALAVHVNTTGLDDAIAAHVHTALAGSNGGITIGLEQDPNDVTHWSAPADAMLTTEQQADYNAGRLYVNVHTPANQAGAVRAQITPPGVQVVYTDLTASEVVPPAAVVDVGKAYSTIIEAEQDLAVNAWIGGPEDTDAVAIHQAPAGQNGTVVYDFAQNATDPTLWSMSDTDVDAAVLDALLNTGLYVQSTSPGAPNGALRGQIETTPGTEPPPEAFTVVSTDPPIGKTAAFHPTSVAINFNRNVLASSAGAEQFELLGAGGDGAFGNGNELAVTIASTAVNAAQVTLDLTGATVNDDLYQLTINGGEDGVTDTASVLLDGDGDGAAGGDFTGSFTVNTAPTLGQVQQIFTANCAFGGCHGGGTPREGMSLVAGQSYADIVNVPSNQVPSLDRIEPGDPDASYLIDKIEGTGLLQRMPAGGDPLPPADIALIRAWVSAGAPNNPVVPDPGGVY
jgi:hypothetical protein